MASDEKKRWAGLKPEARDVLEQRDYTQHIARASEYIGRDAQPIAIPGVELFARTVHQQPHRGHLGEFVRRGEGVLGAIGLWPAQWTGATLFAGTAKGFHIHPPHIPEGEEPEAWFQKLFGEGADAALRPYAKEQWDAMFFVAGVVEMILVDERVGLPRNSMRFLIDGDDRPGDNNAGLVIPPGVAHALRPATSADVLMVYGTSTVFEADFEGRIAAGLERAELPAAWVDYLRAD